MEWNSLLTVLGLVLAALTLLLPVLLPHWDVRLNGWLKRSRHGYLRRKYVDVFVGAVRGESAAGQSFQLAMIRMAGPAWIILLSWMLLLNTFWLEESQRTTARYLITEIASGPEPASDANLPGDDVLAEESRALKAEGERLEAEAAWLNNERANLRTTMERLAFSNDALQFAIVISIVFAIVWGLWESMRVPFYVYRARFAHQLERFTLRIQGLGSKGELAELTACESLVVDEQSARRYVGCMIKIAKRYNVELLCSSFMLWDVVREPEQ